MLTHFLQRALSYFSCRGSALITSLRLMCALIKCNASCAAPRNRKSSAPLKIALLSSTVNRTAILDILLLDLETINVNFYVGIVALITQYQCSKKKSIVHIAVLFSVVIFMTHNGFVLLCSRQIYDV